MYQQRNIEDMKHVLVPIKSAGCVAHRGKVDDTTRSNLRLCLHVLLSSFMHGEEGIQL